MRNIFYGLMDLHACIQFEVLFKKVIEPLEGRLLLEEV